MTRRRTFLLNSALSLMYQSICSVNCVGNARAVMFETTSFISLCCYKSFSSMIKPQLTRQVGISCSARLWSRVNPLLAVARYARSNRKINCPNKLEDNVLQL